eukprot:TRINITY_DN9378_c0_g1_i1.p1 TRINITY_DN9378_c0_g1~~TRINITY_DN9378_c0_g1_i1.p1  ORF type:complete len:644 (+),score=99.81 TRINITY_DN9378_c0_g1_i1:295-2226(+)
MAAPGGNDRGRARYDLEKQGENEPDEAYVMTQPLLAPEPVYASKSKPDGPSGDDRGYQGYDSSDSEEAGISLDRSLLSDEVKRTGFVDGSLRKYKDIPFAVAFLVLLVATVIGGIVALHTGDQEFHRYHDHYIHSHSFINDKGICSVRGPDLRFANSSVFRDGFNPLRLPAQMHGYKHERHGPGHEHVDFNFLVEQVIAWLIVALVLVVVILAALGLGMACNWVFMTYTDVIAKRLIPAFLISLGVTSLVLAFVTGQGSVWFLLLMVVTILSWLAVVRMLRANRSGNIELSIKLLKVASLSLSENKGLVAIMLHILGFAILVVTLVSVLLSRTFVHHSVLVPNPEAVPGAPCGDRNDLDAVPCCIRQLEDWTKVYVAVAGIFVVWSVFLLAHLNTYAISGTVGQWYFAPRGSNSVLFSKAALQNGLGKSFGTVCLSSLISTVVYILRAMVSMLPVRGENCQSVLAIFTRCCMSCLSSAVSVFTRFTTSFTAITGEGFYDSAKLTYNLLKRNFLSTVVVDFYANYILSLYAIICMAAASLVVTGLVYLNNLAINSQSMDAGPDLLQQVLMAADVLLVFLLMALFYVLLWFCQTLQQAVDTIYVCFALDKEVGKVSKQEVHEVYVLLPSTEPDEANLAVGLGGRV